MSSAAGNVVVFSVELILINKTIILPYQNTLIITTEVYNKLQSSRQNIVITIIVKHNAKDDYHKNTSNDKIGTKTDGK